VLTQFWWLHTSGGSSWLAGVIGGGAYWAGRAAARPLFSHLWAKPVLRPPTLCGCGWKSIFCRNPAISNYWGSVERCKLPQWGLGPTKYLVHIQGQNNSSRSNIFVGFAEEKIEHFAKLKQNAAKDTLEREKQVRLEKRNSQKKHNKENAKKPSSSKDKLFKCFTVSKKRAARRSWRKANSSYSGVRTETKRPFQVATN